MHLRPETALDLLEQRLDQDQELFWNRHLQGCNDCAQALEAWRELRSGLKRSHLQSAPSTDVQNAVDLFRPPLGAADSKLKVFATIIFDSFLQPALAGARGPGAGSRQLVLRADEFDIHIKIWGEQDQRQLMGQLLSRTTGNFLQSAQLHLLRNGDRLKTTEVNDLGEFHLTGVPVGDFTLQIDLPNVTVVGALNIG